ncbi:MAG: DsbA family protein, partial [Rickettsiales bacterium]|nr:DsbA family protein [Rickettsiales bacterium]
MKRLLGLVIIAGVIGLIAFASFHFGSSQMKSAEASELSPLHQTMEDDVVIGKAEAPVTIVEYSSLSCPHCASFHEVLLPKIQAKYIDQGLAKYTSRHFPLNEPALRAAMLTECVGKDRRTKFVNVLFELQEKWAFSGDFLDN